MKKPLNSRNRNAAKNAARKAALELHRQYVGFWVSKGYSPRQGRLLARQDVKYSVAAVLAIYCR